MNVVSYMNESSAQRWQRLALETEAKAENWRKGFIIVSALAIVEFVVVQALIWR